MNSQSDRFQTNSGIDRPASDSGIASRLRAYIAEHELRAGDRLPAERHLITELGLPRGALRRALDALEREGVIWRHVGKGTFISGAGGKTSGAPTDWTGDVALQLTPVRMMRARMCIEPAIAREAALNASAQAITRMRHALERACSAPTWEDYETQDDLFHRAIAEATDNPLLVGLFDQLNKVRRAVAFDSVTRSTVRPSADHTSFAEHEEIARSIERRDRAAAQDAMHAHLQSVARRLFDEI